MSTLAGAAESARPRKVAESMWREGTLEQIVRGHVRFCVDENGGNIRAAARDLGVSHTTVMRILARGAKS